ncbi:MAG TPA: glycosyltransferase family 2 protein [Pseudolabrys sp.]|nr:glycosyltransferase family 2 protein [Pseudolabrys sp.]
MTAAKPPTVAFVIPCYNEQAGIQHTIACLLTDINKLEKSKAISPKSYILLIDDGSTDRTWALIERITETHAKRIRGLKLSRNVGHQNALLAGLLAQIGKADAVISLDADLQDDMSVAAKMIGHFNDGAEIVFAVRERRVSDSRFKRGTADLYYRILNWLGADIIPHHADFRLMSDRALRALSLYGEAHVFLRGLAVQLGFKTATVAYDRLPRIHGETKYTIPKMVALAINGITSLSVRPIRMIALMGIMLFVVFIGMTFWVFVAWLAGQTIQGWTSVMLLFLLIASFQTFAIAVIGEYVGKIYFEAKARPRYIIEQEIGTPPTKFDVPVARNRAEALSENGYSRVTV